MHTTIQERIGIRVNNVNFTYPNGTQALYDMYFAIEGGEGGKIVGLLGPNGAGKTTLVHVLTTVLRRFKGEAYIGGLNVKTDYRSIRKIISVAPQELIVDVLLTVSDNLYIHSAINGIPPSLLKQKIPPLLKKLDLWEKKDQLALYLSGGQMRRLQIARCILKSEAQVFFIDEPTIGLDPIGKQIIWNELLELKQENKLIFLASNDMIELERLCDEIIFIDKGRILFKGTVDDAKISYAPLAIIDVEFEKDVSFQQIEEIRRNGPIKITRIIPMGENQHYQFWINQEGNLLFVFLEYCMNQNLGVRKLRIKESTLEEVFYNLAKHGIQ